MEAHKQKQLPFINVIQDNYMIILKCDNVNSSWQELIDKYENMINIKGLECPCCKNKELEYHDHYDRNIIYYNEKIVYNKIKIKVYKCCKCSKNHAIIPSFLIPYKQHSLDLINIVVKEKLVNKESNKNIERKYSITRQLVFKWVKDFMLYLNLLLVIYNSFDIKELFSVLENEGDLLSDFYYKTSQIYLLKRKRYFLNMVFQ